MCVTVFVSVRAHARVGLQGRICFPVSVLVLFN